MTRYFAFDTETHLITPGNLAPKLVCMSIRGEAEHRLLNRDDGLVWLATQLLDGGTHLIGHNVVYDLAVCCNEHPALMPLVFEAYDQGRIHCTMIREKLLLIAQGRLTFDHVENTKPRFGLNDCVWRHFHRHIAKGDDTWRLRYAELDGIPLAKWPKAARTYALDDADYTYRVFWEQAKPLQSQGELIASHAGVRNEHEQAAAHFALHLMSCWGLRVDQDYALEYLADLHEAKDELNEKLLHEGLMKWTRKGKGAERHDALGRNMAAFRERIEAAYFDQGREPPLTPGGKTKTDNDTCRLSGDVLLMEYASEHNAAGLLSKWERFLVSEGTINHGYDPLKETGRTSAFNPPTQQADRAGELRKCFIPRDGNLFLQADYSQIELCALAQVCINMGLGSKLGELINAGTDVHTWMAAHLTSMTYGGLKAMVDAEDEWANEQRRIAKAMNFGFPGGMGNPETFATYARNYGVLVKPDEVKALKATWLQAFPEMRLYFKRISQKFPHGVDYATVVQPGSRRHRGGTRYTAACNTMFQGLAADGAKAAMFMLARACYTEDDEYPFLYGCRPALFVHDEFIVEVPDDDEFLTERAEDLSRLMVSAMELYIEDITVKVDACAMRRWLKSAKPVYKNGRLVPWTP